MSIKVENLKHIYNPNTPFETIALNDVSFNIEKGEFIGLIGHTGSGKSTLVQHLNGILKPHNGKIIINGVDITKPKMNLRKIRQKVGLVFQYPEHQLFEETVHSDVAFGPKNLGLDEEEVNSRVKEAIKWVGLNYEEIKDKSPFELSGGQKRRVAIAGVVAMKPEVLILDEPTAGLDPKARDDILNQIKKLHNEYKMNIILVSHSMEDISRLVDRIIVMHKGKIALMGRVKEVFKESKLLTEIGLGVPQITVLVNKLNEKGINIKNDIFTIDEAKIEILKWMRSK